MFSLEIHFTIILRKLVWLLTELVKTCNTQLLFNLKRKKFSTFFPGTFLVFSVSSYLQQSSHCCLWLFGRGELLQKLHTWHNAIIMMTHPPWVRDDFDDCDFQSESAFAFGGSPPVGEQSSKWSGWSWIPVCECRKTKDNLFLSQLVTFF